MDKSRYSEGFRPGRTEMFLSGFQHQQMGQTMSSIFLILAFRLPTLWYEKLYPRVQRAVLLTEPCLCQAHTNRITLILMTAPWDRRHSSYLTDESSPLGTAALSPRITPWVMRGLILSVGSLWAPRAIHNSSYKDACLERQCFQVTVYSWFKEGK